ncbi:MAG: YaaL family protein [Clostridiales bacterium]|jgi:hypothetical protein|nr:YaaL family protein [Clostridiales bacterium]
MSAVVMKYPAVLKAGQVVENKTRAKSEVDSDTKELLNALEGITRELDILYNQFDFITDPALIEACIYSIKAAHAKYAYYHKQAKDKHITA